MVQSTSDAHRQEINKKSVSQCPIILVTQIRNEKPCLEARPSSRNQIHRVLKLRRESENKLKQRSTFQRKITRLMRVLVLLLLLLLLLLKSFKSGDAI